MSAGYGLFGFNPDGGTFELMAMQQGVLSGWPSSGSFIQRCGGFTDGVPTTMIKAGQQSQLDVLIINNGIDDPFVMYQDHTFYDLLANQYYSMPKTTAMCYYGDRVWTLLKNYMAYSDAFPPTYYPTSAQVIGNQTTYSYTTGDALKVTIDTVLTDNISLAGCSTISQVARAINTACGGAYATVGVYPNPVGVLIITSATVGTSSIVTVTDATSMASLNPARTIVNNLFSSDPITTNGYAPYDLVTNVFRVPVGTAQALIATRDQGIVAMGADQIWQLLPSQIPSPTTDQPQKVLDIGCVAGATAVQVADDIIFLAPDGVRGLFRTQLDKLQTGQSYPLSYPIPEQIDSINWAAINKACAVFFSNKYIISLPVNGSSYNNLCLVYYPSLSTAFYASTNQSNPASTKSWVIYEGWNISRFAIMNIGGQQNLYGIDAVTGQVYQLFEGTTDNGNTIVYDEQSKADDFKVPLQYKYGGEYKLRAEGGNGVLTVAANADGLGWVQLGSLSLTTTGITFPTTFPVNFPSSVEVMGTFHLDDYGIIKFKRCQFEISSNTNEADITIIETLATAFQEPYISEG
jgi:hypothetical protein